MAPDPRPRADVTVPDACALERTHLTRLPGGGTLLTATSLVDSFEARDAFVAGDMPEQLRVVYDRLEELLQG